MILLKNILSIDIYIVSTLLLIDDYKKLFNLKLNKKIFINYVEIELSELIKYY